MSHTSRTVMAAMIHAHREARATARPERATDEVISDLAERLTRAINAVQDLAAGLTGPNEDSVRTTRLAGKTEGLKVALSYVQEIQRATTSRACPSQSIGHPEDALPCLLPDGHDGWHKGLGAVWSGGIPTTTAPEED